MFLFCYLLYIFGFEYLLIHHESLIKLLFTRLFMLTVDNPEMSSIKLHKVLRSIRSRLTHVPCDIH